MIRSGYNPVSESVSGELAAALNSADKKTKRNLIYALSRDNIDFNRSIGTAELVKDNDPRLRTDGNIVIGIYEDANGKKCLTAYRVGDGIIAGTTPSITMVRDKSGKVVKLPNFENVSWKKWISIMTSFYIIEKDKAVEVQGTRKARMEANTVDNASEKLTAKVKEIVKRYGYSIRYFDYSRRYGDPWKNITIVNTDRTSKVGVVYDKDQFKVSTVGTWLTEPESAKFLEDLSKATTMIHKLNQVNFDRVSTISDREE